MISVSFSIEAAIIEWPSRLVDLILTAKIISDLPGNVCGFCGLISHIRRYRVGSLSGHIRFVGLR